MTPTLDVANFLIIRAAVSSFQASLIAVAGQGSLLAMDGTRRVPSDAAPLGIRALPVAFFRVEVEAVVDRLRAEPGLDRVAAKIK